ncbi:asparagine synthase (glutamine-hydrolyzing) [Polytolypa hystricis UAMH7299]|uniref:asparagine synthase (glutamine-hydrolyzing) n=1 Tax=Polytolypa hystricis (strain UAMH7299) TaxID=1447883 RepID=A0A2B7YPF5_POLH7|nr:asparagine synthase (glutamine-hydrolyzing) [Polytolypa hystricis UAMH7299]
MQNNTYMEVHPDVQKFKPTALRMAKAWKLYREQHKSVSPHAHATVYLIPEPKTDSGGDGVVLAHERLSIVGVESGAQPLINDDETLALAVNGEIYNHRILRKNFKTPYNFKTHSDCEVIIPLYMEHGIDAPKYLDGMFSWVLYDKKEDRVVAARDPIGITSFYQGWSSKTPGAVYFASELKALHPVCDKIVSFPPGHIYDSKTDTMTRYYDPKWWDPTNVPTTPIDYKQIRSSLEKSVRKRLMAEVPYGVLLSGGLDSSLVASIAQRETQRMQVAPTEKPNGAANGVTNGTTNGATYGYGTNNVLVGIDDTNELTTVTTLPQLHSFSIGLPGAPDSKAAMEVAEFLGTKHYAFTFTVEDGLNALSDVIYHLETYDVTTIRASTPMYLLSRKIKTLGVKMVHSGEGSDEIFGGYLYFHAAPDKEAFHAETVRRVKNLHLADCLRANKSTSAWGLEARVPFLDKEFLEVTMGIDPKEKMITKDRIEKYILRKAFDTTDEPDVKPYLPQKILWRQKEQFSDGVGYGWIDALKDNAASNVTDEMMKNPKVEWGDDIPDTKEAYWYRLMFDEHFPPYCASTVSRWAPTWSEQSDPSGRAIATHNDKYEGVA